MIIVDLNQVMLSNLMMQLGNHTNAELSEDMIRHMIINSLRSYRQKFGPEYGELVIACDNTNIWRKKIFPYYKANRKKSRDNSELDWKNIFEILGNIRSELKEYFPYRIIDLESAEADDIIGTLVTKFSTEDYDKILIMSGDKDFIQLHKYPNVKQYDPVRKKWIQHNDPMSFLKEHILKGDTGDGVPNILSKDDVFMKGERQKPVSAKRLQEFIENGFIACKSEEERRNWHRNATLVNFDFIPEDVQKTIVENYINSKPTGDKMSIMNYLMEHRCRLLLDEIEEF